MRPSRSRRAATPAEAAAGAGLVIEVTADDASSRTVWLDARTGILAGAAPGAVLATSATLSVGWVVVAQGRVRLRDAGYQLIDHNGDGPLESLGIHRLIPDDLAKGVPIDEVAQRRLAEQTW